LKSLNFCKYTKYFPHISKIFSPSGQKIFISDTFRGRFPPFTSRVNTSAVHSDPPAPASGYGVLDSDTGIRICFPVSVFLFPAGNKIRRVRMRIRGFGSVSSYSYFIPLREIEYAAPASGYGESDADTGSWIRIRGVGCEYGEVDADTGIRICFPVSVANAGR
jgi:hypothetical protein